MLWFSWCICAGGRRPAGRWSRSLRSTLRAQWHLGGSGTLPAAPNEPQAGVAVLSLLWLDWKPGPVAGKGWGTGDEMYKPMSQEHRPVGTSSEPRARP